MKIERKFKEFNFDHPRWSAVKFINQDESKQANKKSKAGHLYKSKEFNPWRIGLRAKHGGHVSFKMAAVTS